MGPVRLLIAGKVKQGHDAYWAIARTAISELPPGIVLVHDQFIPDADVEVYFLAADGVVLPYREIYQSGLPFLAYSFGLPVIATRVGALPDDVQEERTGFLAEPGDPDALASAIRRFYESDLYRQREARQADIRAWALAEHSWATVGQRLADSYRHLNAGAAPAGAPAAE
jgi:glycosyltransferase involved in cell wall biosynthesis